jgi:hypothetical protein
MFRRTIVALAFVLGACGTGEALEPDPTATGTPLPTVPGVGQVPDAIPIPSFAEGDGEPRVSVVVTRPIDDEGVVLEALAERVNGNRLIVVGDSILASTASRYGEELCTALNPLGWDVEVNAEPGRFVEFGNKVLSQQIPADVSDEDDFDAAVVHLGSNYNGDQDNYREELNEVLFRIAPRPTLLLTVTEYRPSWAEVNEVIDELAELYDNVTVVDWEKVARIPGVLSRDGLHPGSQGEDVLVEQISVAMGESNDEEGECLRSSFTDDSAIGSGSGSGSSSGGSSSGSSSGGSSGSGSSSGSSSGGSSSGSSSSSGGSTSGSTTGGSTTTGGATTSGTDTGGTDTGGTETTGSETSTGGSTEGTTTEGTTTEGGSTEGTTTEGTTTEGGTTTAPTTVAPTTVAPTTAAPTTAAPTTAAPTTAAPTTAAPTTAAPTTAALTEGE